MKFRFPIIIIDEDFRSENISGSGIRDLAEAIETEGMEVIGLTSYGDLTSFAQQASRASCFIVSIDDEEFISDSEDHDLPALNNLRAFITEVRKRNEDIPIFLYGETRTSRHMPNDILRELHGFIHMNEDTPEFVARHIIREAKVYLDSLAPPFFRALTNYASEGSYSWHCPGHSGGVAFLKSPVGRMFHQFFGENMLRADVCNAVEELGQLLDHTGPVLQMMGAIPIFLMPTRNHLGIIGPIPKEEFEWKNIKKKIDANPFIKDKNVVPRVMTLTQSTYDGIIYNVEMIKEMLDGKVDSLHFDEAWLPHAAFHPFYKDMHAIGSDRKRTKKSLMFATQSTHKLLAGLSQASQVLVQDAEDTKLDRDCFNEAYLMHTSTSPQYAIIASCDVSAAMMESPGGTTLVEESIAEAMDFRRAMREVDDKFGADWWFKVWGPDHLAEEGIGERSDWILEPKASWHDFGNLAQDFNMLDPIKATVVTPGLDIEGNFGSMGIPASIVTKYLAEHGVIVEKCGLYSFFIMFTIGITKGRWNTLVTELQQFKDHFDKNAPLWKVLPEFVAKHPRYERVGLKDICQQIHEFYKSRDVARMTTEMYTSDMVPAMMPSEAWAKMAHKEVDRVPLDKLEDRITAMLVTPYPPGIPLLIPGERFNKRIIDYLYFARDFNEKFPGFETDIHGLVKGEVDGHSEYYVDCVRNTPQLEK